MHSRCSRRTKDQIGQAVQVRTEKPEAQAKAHQAAADAKADLRDTAATLYDDSKYHADLTATCEQKYAAVAAKKSW